jgi:hypothetical protein
MLTRTLSAFARAVARLAVGSARRPGTAVLLAYCFATFAWVAPMAAHYVYFSAMDITARDVAQQRRAGVSHPAGRMPADGLAGMMQNLQRCWCGPLAPSKVWPRNSSSGSGSGSGSAGSGGGGTLGGVDAAERGEVVGRPDCSTPTHGGSNGAAAFALVDEGDDE